MRYTQKQWLQKGTELFGDDYLNWKFVCPACGKVSSIKDFKEYTEGLDAAFLNCIGRHNGKGKMPNTDGYQEKYGCNWTAGGLFKTLLKGHVVIFEDGKEIDVFPFYEGDDK